MDDNEALRRIDRELAAVQAKIDHMPNAAEMKSVRKEFADADYQTLREVSQQIGHLRSDVKEWINSSRSDAAAQIAHLETRLMGAIKSDQSWKRQLPIYIMLAAAVVALLSGNPFLMRLGGLFVS